MEPIQSLGALIENEFDGRTNYGADVLREVEESVVEIVRNNPVLLELLTPPDEGSNAGVELLSYEIVHGAYVSRFRRVISQAIDDVTAQS